MTPGRRLVETGQSLNLTCLAQSGPMNMFQWTHIPTNTLLSPNFVDEMQSVITITNVQPEDQGEYRCNATNEAGSYAASGTVVGECHVHISNELGMESVINLPVSPRGNVEVSVANYTAGHGDSVVVNCTARGGPGTLFAWVRNGTERLCFNCSSVAAGTNTDVQSNRSCSYMKLLCDLFSLSFSLFLSLQVSSVLTPTSWSQISPL